VTSASCNSQHLASIRILLIIKLKGFKMATTNFSSVADIQNAIIVTKSDLNSLRSAIKYNLNKMKELKTSLSEIKSVAKLQKSVDAVEKAKAREAKRELAIERARAKLEKLLAKPVGKAAKKAAKKPSAVTVLRAA
jgi:hypothetical protein